MTDFPSLPFEKGEKIEFNTADINFQLDEKDNLISWLKNIIDFESGSVEKLNYVFCSDQFLHELNVKYLQHDTLTDIITFPIQENPIQSDIYISLDRVKENAQSLSLPFHQELNRVIVHGLLHLLGYGDKTPKEKALMREKEDYALSLLGRA